MELIDKILKLKKERNAIILSHNYQIPEVQDIADFVGDSLGLSKEAAKTDSDVIVFCGVHFMAETASIICPDKKVLIPDSNAGCPMANMIKADDLIKLKEENPGAIVVAYVNTTADVKAESDVCCTSSNAEKILKKVSDEFDADAIIFIPDKYLGMYAGKNIQSKIILWHGYCPTHVAILEEDVKKVKKEHPSALVLVHPECRPEVSQFADVVASTEGIIKSAKELDAKEFIIGTETGILHRLKKENPDKKFYPASEKAVCPNMKKISLEKILWCLEDMKPEVKVNESIRKKALKPVEKMLELI